MRRSIAVLCVLCVALTVSAVAQQTFVSRFDTFAGYSYLTTPTINLTKHGYNLEGGVNIFRWLSMGVDYSAFNGDSTIVPSYLNSATQAQLAAALGQLAQAGQLPPGFKPAVPYDAHTWTFAAGPQINIRHFKPVTLFVRPALGIYHESLTSRAADPINQALVLGLLNGVTKKSDTVVNFGFGGGFDLNFSQHLGLRVAADYSRTSLFESFLAKKQHNVRVSFGPTFRFGNNILKNK